MRDYNLGKKIMSKAAYSNSFAIIAALILETKHTKKLFSTEN